MVRDPGAEEAELRRSSDVDDVGAETAGVREDARQVPPVRQIEAQILLHGKGECAAGQLEGAHLAILGGPIRGPCTHTEEGQAVAAGEGLKVSAGVGYAVDLVECIRKVRDSGWGGERRTVRGRRHDGSVCGAPKKRNCYEAASPSPRAKCNCRDSFQASRRLPRSGALPMSRTMPMLSRNISGA